MFTHSLPNDDNTIKSQPLNNVTQKELNYIMGQLNYRPRKTLGFKTPYELFFKMNTLLTVALHTWIRQIKFHKYVENNFSEEEWLVKARIDCPDHIFETK